MGAARDIRTARENIVWYPRWRGVVEVGRNGRERKGRKIAKKPEICEIAKFLWAVLQSCPCSQARENGRPSFWRWGN